MEGNVKTQEFCCSKEGFRVSKVNIVDRQRAHTPVTRTRCKAKFVVTTTNTSDQWVVSKSSQKHNHALCTPAMTLFMRSNRAVSKADVDEATSLKDVSVGTSQEINYLTQQARGYHNVGFTHKDLYNALQRVDELGALHNLIWSDSTSRSDYTCFGDVIGFDITYKDNLYGQPIMAIVSVNHHHNAIVFATAIIADETSQSFKAMQRAAIKTVIPSAKHILCSWHLSHNAQANIEFNIEKHPWVIEKGNTRYLWAQAYLIGHFFANIRSTQMCESMNVSLAIALKNKKTYLNVVRAIEKGISRMRMNELKADYLSSQTKPFQITKLIDLESHAAEIYTREFYRLFQEELQRETLYQLQEEIQSLSDECQNYILTNYKEKNKTFDISFDFRTETINCSCRKFETVGIPCRQQLHVLMYLDYTYLPGSLIQSRWTKDAKACAPSFVDLNVPLEVMQMARFAALRATSSRLCYIASKIDTPFKTTRDE
ncbi:hypothetical protein F3Y22_tig00001713pilonHSYRG00015 [Hibiscus syriacus]|uniref:SWIM-type domain-containing protein n=1 Tax=Hibiscus syriacus TaxID=106335 RepID=A0A6A3CU54_HIBSY|nr:hypothetical protein F3Y22_tig00001713pilonHSYRG00015 [Hibiscus syriacus]